MTAERVCAIFLICIAVVFQSSAAEVMHTRNNKTCIFPFKWENKWHYHCLRDEMHNPQYGSWCAVDYADYDTHFKMGYCINTTIVPTTTLDGKDCVFPFTYNNKLQYECVYDKISTWCSTQPGVYESHRQWGYCVGGYKGPAGTRATLLEKRDFTNALNQNLTVSGRPCKFPFKWQGFDIHECVKDFQDKYWCEVDDAGTWDFCLQYPKKEPKVSYEDQFAKVGDTKKPVNASACKVTAAKISQEDRDTIIKYANLLRKKQNAANMRKITWSEHLAERAQYFTDTCPDDHGETWSCYGHTLGQNLVMGFSHSGVNWKWNIYMAFGKSEEPYYNIGDNSCGGQGICGHYTQSVWAETHEIGCAYSNCKDKYTGEDLQLLVCNYYPAGNQIEFGKSATTTRRPFLYGEPCSQCDDATYPYPYKCVDGAFCEPCPEGDASCKTYDLCVDHLKSNATGNNDICGNQRTLSWGCIYGKHDYVNKPNSFEYMRQNCRKSCQMCNEPYDQKK